MCLYVSTNTCEYACIEIYTCIYEQTYVYTYLTHTKMINQIGKHEDMHDRYIFNKLALINIPLRALKIELVFKPAQCELAIAEQGVPCALFGLIAASGVRRI